MIRLFVLVLCFLAIVGCCQEKDSFNYQGKPIIPYCVGYALGVTGSDQQVQKTAILSKCTKEVEGDPKYDKKDGWFYSYYPREKEDDPYLPTTGYKIFLQSKNEYLVGVWQWPGGTGKFDYLITLKRENNKLDVIKVLNQGDRCNRGLTYEGVKDGVLYFSVALTAMDLLSYAPQVKVDVKPYKDLDACAACCYAAANYSYKLGDGEPKLLSIELNDKVVDNPKERAKEMKYQYCMNEIYNRHIKNKKTKLVGRQIYDFVKEFKDRCFK